MIVKRKPLRPLALRLLLAALALALLGGAVAEYRLDALYPEETFAYVGRHRTGVGQLTSQPVTQTFTVDQANLAAVEVMFSNYAKKPQNGTLTLTLTDGAGTVLAQADYPVAEQKNNAFLTLDLPEPLADSAGQTYTLSAVSDCTDEKGVTLRMGPRVEDAPAGVLTLADGTQDAENFLNMRACFVSVRYGWQGAYILAALGLACLLCLPLAGKEKTHG